MECSATMRKLRISLSAIEFSTMRVEFSAVQIQRNSAPYHNRLLATAIVNGAHAPRSYCIEIHCVLFSIAFGEMPRNKSTRKTFDARISVGRFFRCFFLYTLCFFEGVFNCFNESRSSLPFFSSICLYICKCRSTL